MVHPLEVHSILLFFCIKKSQRKRFRHPVRMFPVRFAGQGFYMSNRQETLEQTRICWRDYTSGLAWEYIDARGD